MILTKSLNKIKIVIYSAYGILVISTILVVYLVITNIRTAQSTSNKLIETHTTQLDVSKFNKVLQEIKRAME